MPRLPFDVVVFILCYLPVKPLKRFRCVAKSWRSLIDSDRFIKSHLKMTLRTNSHRHVVIVGSGLNIFSLNLDNADPFKAIENAIKPPFLTRGIDVLNTCNGLFLIWRPLTIWNPFTTEFKYLPEIGDDDPPFPSGCFSSIAYGFAYDSENDDYKVVRVVTHMKVLRLMYVTAHIYSLKSNSWRLITEEFTYPVVNHRLTHVNGALHTLSTAYTSPEDTRHTIIMAFSVESEKHYEVKLPSGLSNGCNAAKALALYNLGGCLALICYVSESSCEIWVMNEYGVRKSWKKMLSLPYCYLHMKPMATTKDGNKFMFYSDFSFFSHNLRNAADLKSVPVNDTLYYLEESIENLVFLHGEKQVQRQGRLHGDQDKKQDKNEIRKKRFKLKH